MCSCIPVVPTLGSTDPLGMVERSWEEGVQGIDEKGDKKGSDSCKKYQNNELIRLSFISEIQLF